MYEEHTEGLWGVRGHGNQTTHLTFQGKENIPGRHRPRSCTLAVVRHRKRTLREDTVDKTQGATN